MKLIIRMLGGFQVELDGREVHGFESDKARALLAYLAAENDRPHRREQLAGLLWPDFPEANARRNLSQALYNLRQALADRPDTAGKTKSNLFETDNQCLSLKPDQVGRVDLALFRSGLAGCPDHNPSPMVECQRCRPGLETAASLYQGEFLAGLSLDDAPAFDEWLLLERERLHQAALTTLHDLAAWHRRQGALDQAAACARRAVSLDPLWEPGRRQLMHALWLSGQRSEALAQYDAGRRLLWDELGVTPDEESEKLYRRILADTEPISPRPAGRSNLPYALTPFIGRERALREIMGLLARPECRLLTLVGPGGSGKSRLAVETARRLVDDFPDGVFLVAMAQIASAGLIPAFLAQALQLPAQDQVDVSQQVLNYLREKRLLLIMDSFERLPDGAGFVLDILRQAAGVRVLTTSRVRLSAKGEHVYPISGMELPDQTEARLLAESEAVRLFLSAAERTIPGYQPGGDALPAIATICRLVEGMPLGIILASAWLQVYRPATIARQIERSLDFLAVEWADLPPRQRSLRATLDYTWQLLDGEQKEALAALSVHRGSFTAEAASYVAGLDGPALLGLSERSVIQYTAGDRFAIHDLLNQYAAERLAERPEAQYNARSRHADYFTTLAAGLAGDLKGAGQQAALAELEADSANITAAWLWAAGNGQFQWLEEALEGVALYYHLSGRFQEGEQACAAAAEALSASQSEPNELWLLVMTLTWQARFVRLSGRAGAAENLSRGALELADGLAAGERHDQRARAFLYLELGNERQHIDRNAALSWFQQSLALYRALGDQWAQAQLLLRLADLAHHRGHYAEALSVGQEALALYRQVGDPRGTAKILVDLGNYANRVAKFDEADAYVGESVEIFEKLGDRFGRATSLWNLARNAWWAHGMHEEALAIVQQSLPIFKDTGHLHDTAFVMSATAAILLASGRYEQAKVQSEESLAFSEAAGFPRWIGFSHLWLGAAALVTDQPTEARDHFEHCRETYLQLTQKDELASASALLAWALYGLGQKDEARATLREALTVSIETRGTWAIWFTIPVVAVYLASTGRLERGIEAFSVISRFPQVSNSTFLADIAGRPIERMSQSLPTEVVEQALLRGRQADLWEAIEALLAELS